MWERGTFGRRLSCCAGVLLASAAFVMVLGPAGCSGSDAEAEQPQVDPRYASADAVLDLFNEAAMEPFDFTAITALFHAENDAQQEMLDMLTALEPMAELDIALAEQFGGAHGMDDSVPLALEEPARIVSRSDRRAVAEFGNVDAETRELHLVEANGRWWISGYTLEYDEEFVENDELKVMAEISSVIGGMIRDFTGRVRSGEFDSPLEAQIELGKELQEKHPDEARRLMNMGN